MGSLFISATALWVHVVHEQDLKKAWADPIALCYVADTWRPELVVP